MNNKGMTVEATINELVANGRKALAELEKLNQEQIDALCVACCKAFEKEAEAMAKMAVEETGLGNVPSKIGKNSGAPTAVMYAINGLKTVGIIKEEPERHCKLVAHPKGIVSCVIPTTNPNMTIIFNGVYALKGRNVIICAPHPRAKKSTVLTCKLLQQAILDAGGPDNVFQWVEDPSMELTQAMMAASDVVLGTGGPGMVKAAYSSGKPAYGVGPGNSQTIFDPDYDDLETAVAETIMSATFDNGIVCACARSFITPKAITAKMLEIMKAQKIYYTDDPVIRDKIRDCLFPNGYGKLNGDPVGQDVQTVAKMIGIDVPEDTALIVVKVDKYGFDEPLCREKMLPVSIHIEAEDVYDALAIAKTNLLAEGAGHSSVLYTRNQELADYAGVYLPVSRMVINGPGVMTANAFCNIGLTPTGTLGCGSWGGNSVSENVGPQHMINVTRICELYPPEDIPTPEQIWSGEACYLSNDFGQ